MTASCSHDDRPERDPARKATPTLLVVEDDVIVRFSVSDSLRGAGYTVLEAATADEAREIVRSVAVDLLFIDLHLYGGQGDGLSVARFARESRPWMKTVFTSGKIAPDQVPELDGFGPFIAKPYLFSRLIELVRRTLAGEDD